MKCPRQIRKLPLIAVVAALAACNTTSVTPRAADPGPAALPAPALVVVEDFDLSGAQVTLDSGIGPRAKRMAQGGSETADKRALAASVVGTITRTVTEQLRRDGLIVVPAVSSATNPVDAKLVVAGRMIDIDQGNATKRNAIGLGAGASSVKAVVEIAYAGPAGRTVLERFDAEQKSGRKPGALATMGGSAAGAAVGTVVGAALTSVERDASNLADTVADKVTALWRARGWGGVR